MSILKDDQIKNLGTKMMPSKRKQKSADVITHGFGVVLSFIGFIFLMMMSTQVTSSAVVIAIAIYGISLITAYFSSTIYHLYVYYHPLPNKKFRRLLLIFDHAAIFLLIAGTYTPLVVKYLNNTKGYILLGTIWSLTVMGIIYKFFYIGRFRRFSLILYFVMGWLIIGYLNDLLIYFPQNLFILLGIGGAFYTFGVIFFQYTKMPYNHAIWHIFVLIGSVFHFFGILFYVI